MTADIRKSPVPEICQPLVSVVMPVVNEEAFIVRSLRSVFGQTYPKERIEIIVADGMSTDRTRDLIREAALETTIPITIVDNPGRIAPMALNRAIETSVGDVIIRVDGHCEIDPDYVGNCVSILAESRADGVGGPITTIGQGTQAKAIAVAMSSSFGVGGSAFRTINDREMYTDTVAFPGTRGRIVELAGPYNEELVRNQDDEYNYRIRKLGGRILLSPTIRSVYYSRGTFASLWKQYFQYGYWKVRVFQLHPAQMRLRQFIPGAFVLSLILAVGILLVFPAGWAAFAILSGSYVIANIAAAIYVGKNSPTLIPLLSLSFAILHLSYGSGFLLGLISFSRNWLTTRSNDLVPDNR